MASRATYTTNLNLVKPDVDDSYDITLSNDNMDKVDKAVGDLKTAIENIDWADTNISITDAKNKFEGTTLDKVLDEIDDKIVDTSDKVDNIDLAANKVKYTDTHTLGATDLQQAVDKTIEKSNTDINNLKKAVKESRAVVSSTLTASKWQDNTYSFETEYPHAQYDIAIELGESATLEQAYAFADACLKGSIGTQIITALDIVPTIDIPITIEVLKKWE